MASDLQNKNLSDSITLKDSRPSAEKKLSDRNREEKLRIAKERQHEERQRKIEELKAQAEAAQRFREQKEEERRRRIEELRNRDNEKRHLVEERKRAIMEAEKERREYIMRKNQERSVRLETRKRHEKSQIVFAFGSSTPRLLDPADMVSVSPGAYWGNRRSTSISNVAFSGPTLTRRSSERELSDGSKKRATSAGGIDRHNEALRRNKSGSMYEVFNWGFCNDEPPKRYSLSIIGHDIDIDGPAIATTTLNTNYKYTSNTTFKQQQQQPHQQQYKATYQEETSDSPATIYRSVARRKTDLMPTIPMPREPNFGSKSSLSHTPRTPGRAVSMTRLDQLAQPVRRNGEHIRAIIERERIQQLESEMMASTNSSPSKSMSRSMTHLSGGNKHNIHNNHNSNHHHFINSNKNMVLLNRPLKTKDSSKSMSMTQLSTRAISSTKKFINRFVKPDNNKDDAHNSNNNSYLSQSGSRSGDVTPGGSVNPSRPGSAMSTSTTTSTLVQRRSMPAPRKPRPASIAGTGVTLNDEYKQRKDKPPIPKSVSTTPKRTSLSNSGSVTKLSLSAEKRSSTTQHKKEQTSVSKPLTPAKSATPAKIPSNNQTPVKTPTSAKKVSHSTANPRDANHDKHYEVTVTDMMQSYNQDKQQEIQKHMQEVQSKAEKNAINIEKIDTIEIVEIVPNTDGNTASVVEYTNTETGFETILNDTSTEITATNTNAKISNYDTYLNNGEHESVEEKIDLDTEKEQRVREALQMERLQQQQNNEMTASMIARKITTEEEAKAALAERRRLAREEAERQAELERQRLETERQEELRRQSEEEERQRQFEEEAIRLAEAQRKAEEERLQLAIEEARKREEEERLKREEDEKLKAEREESEQKAKEEAEKQRLEVAERLKREEKEREERRKRVEAIMSRTRKAGGTTPNSTPIKESNGESKSTDQKISDENQEQSQQDQQEDTLQKVQQYEQEVQQNATEENHLASVSNDNNSNTTTTSSNNISDLTNNSDNNIISTQQEVSVVPELDIKTIVTAATANDKTQAQQSSYEQTVTDKENALIKNFSNMIIDQQQNVKNLQQNFIENLQNNPFVEVTNGTATHQQQQEELISNGNGHIENMNNKNDAKSLVDMSGDQLIDFGNSESHQISNDAVNFNNNNLLTSSTTLVTADSHENKEISLL